MLLDGSTGVKGASTLTALGFQFAEDPGTTYANGGELHRVLPAPAVPPVVGFVGGPGRALVEHRPGLRRLGRC